MLPRSRYTSGRSYLTPEGTDRPFVREGNHLSARVVCLIHLACARGLRYLLEQPSGTILEHMPWMQKLWGLTQAVAGCSPIIKQMHTFIYARFVYNIYIYGHYIAIHVHRYYIYRLQ